MAFSLFSLLAWQSSLQVLFGLPLGLGPSTSYSLHFFTQSSFRSTCPYQSSLFCCRIATVGIKMSVCVLRQLSTQCAPIRSRVRSRISPCTSARCLEYWWAEYCRLDASSFNCSSYSTASGLLQTAFLYHLNSSLTRWHRISGSCILCANILICFAIWFKVYWKGHLMFDAVLQFCWYQTFF